MPQPTSALNARGGCKVLGPSLVRAAESGNELRLVVVTFVNMAQVDFALNWHAHVAQAGLRASAIVGATDGAAALSLDGAGVRCFRLESGIGVEEAKWGSPGFSQMGRTKVCMRLWHAGALSMVCIRVGIR